MFVEEDLPMPLVDSDRAPQSATIPIPESLHASINESLYIYLTLKRERLEVARSEVLVLRIRKNGEFAPSRAVGMMLNAEIAPVGGLLSTILTAEIE